MNFTLPQIARALGGEISAGQVLAPGPGHSKKDRSLAVKVGDTGKLVVSSFAGDDYRRCLQHVESKLGIVWQPERGTAPQTSPIHRMQARVTDNQPKPGPDDAMARKQAFALQLWSEAVDPRGTIVETYLASRGLVIPDDAAMEVIRFHPMCSFGKGTRHPCMVAAFHSIETGEVVAIHRTALTPEGSKIGRLTLGPMGGAAIKLSRLDPERGCLAIGEGIESTLAGIAMGFSPAWAMGTAGNIVKLPVLPGVDTLTILGERDGGANAKAVQLVGSAWLHAGREVLLAMPKSGFGEDANDAWQTSQDSSGIEVTDFSAEVGSSPDYSDSDEDDRGSEVGPEPIRPLESVSASWLLAQPLEPRAWHVPDMVPAGTVTMLSGDGATGKSLIALQLGVATVLGSGWLGNPVEQGPALFITAEDELSETHHRLHEICSSDGIRTADVEQLRITSLAGKDALLAVPDSKKGGTLQATRLFAETRALAELVKPRLIVLDTLADLFGGNEIDRAQARQFIGMLRGLAIDCSTTVLLLGHPSLSGMASGTGSSGSTAWNNSVRSRLYLKRIIQMDGKSPVEANTDLRSLTTMKANYGKAGGEIILRWREGRFVPDRQETVGSSFAAGAAKSRADSVFRELLVSYAEQGRTVSSKPSGIYAPHVFAHDERAEGITKKGFTDAMNRLFTRGEIQNVESGPPSKLRSHIAMASIGSDEPSEVGIDGDN